MTEQRKVIARVLSLFHVFIPVLLIWATTRLGYDRRGYYFQTALTWLVIPITYLLAPAERNINWVHEPFGKPQHVLDPTLYVGVLMVAYPLLVYLPSHLFANAVFRRASHDK